MSDQPTPADEFRAIAGRFTAVVEGVPDDAAWRLPSPVPAWTARDVVGHLVGWFPSFLEGGAGVTLPRGPAVEDDPVAAWKHHVAGVQGLLDQRADEEFTHPYLGPGRLAETVDRFYTSDVFMHSWDLARATGQEPRLDQVFAGQMLEGMRPIESMLAAPPSPRITSSGTSGARAVAAVSTAAAARSAVGRMLALSAAVTVRSSSPYTPVIS